MTCSYTKGEGEVTAPWRVEADRAASRRLGCRAEPFQAKGGTRAERRCILRTILRTVLPGWLPHFEVVEPCDEPSPVMVPDDLVERREIVAEPIQVMETLKMSAILRGLVLAKRAADRLVMGRAEGYREPVVAMARQAFSGTMLCDAYGGRLCAA